MPGRWLKELREARGLTQVETSAILRVTLRAYQRWEEGSREPSPRHRAAIADLFGPQVYIQFAREDRVRLEASA